MKLTLQHLRQHALTPGRRLPVCVWLHAEVTTRALHRLHLWGWSYRFEAYTPLAKRKLGYYAMPLLWRDEVIRPLEWHSKQKRKDSGISSKSPENRFPLDNRPSR